MAFTDDDQHVIDAGMSQECCCSMPKHRLAANLLVLLRDFTTGAQAGTCCYNNNGCGHGEGVRSNGKRVAEALTGRLHTGQAVSVETYELQCRNQSLVCLKIELNC